MEMDRFYSHQEWKERCVKMGEKVGDGGNDMYLALQRKLNDFVGADLNPQIRKAKRKTLILFTDGQDDAIIAGQPARQTEKLRRILRL